MPLRRTVSIKADEKQIEGTTVDLSFDGVLVQSYLVLPTGTLVSVTLPLQTASARLQVEGRVVRTVGSDHMGLQFTRLGAKESSRWNLSPLILRVT